KCSRSAAFRLPSGRRAVDMAEPVGSFQSLSPAGQRCGVNAARLSAAQVRFTRLRTPLLNRSARTANSSIMRFPVAFIIALVVLGRSAFGAVAADLPGWDLVWSDEFDGRTLNRAKWEFEVNAEGGGNNELQYYVTNNVRLQDGLLFIDARREHYTGPRGTREYTSARIRTKGKGDWRYGRFDIRARLPRGQGIWPALWMMPSRARYGDWPRSGE